MRSAGSDLTTKARIRDTAIACFAESGVDGTSIRAIASAAGVSPGLVMHHFGSKDGLRVACDEFVAATIREQKNDVLAQGSGLDPLATLRSTTDGPPLLKYLAKTLMDGSAHVNDLVDELVNDAVQYFEIGVESGLLNPSHFPRERAAILTLWSLGGLVLHDHFTRILGVDMTTDLSQDPAAFVAYAQPALELLSGLVTATTKQIWEEAMTDLPGDEKETK